MSTPAELLTGITLDGGWSVTGRTPISSVTTGGFFSVGYVAEQADGSRGFVKALDFHKAISGTGDPIDAVNKVTEAFAFERDLLERCRNARMDKIVLAIDEGNINVPGFGALGVVPYLIFELAERDIRAQIDFVRHFDLAWTLRSLHNVAVGLKQLHRQEITHKDLKPSNVLMFHRSLFKIADLGRAARKGYSAPHDSTAWSHGDRGYAPLELLYGREDPDWNVRNIGCDAYLLGSMIVFFFTGVSMTSLVLSQMDPAHRHDKWTGGYDTVFPYVQDAFGKALNHFAAAVPENVRKDLTQIVSELCNPDPKLRGSIAARRGGRNFMETYVTRLNVLAYNAERGLLRT